MKTNKVATGILGALAMAGALGLGACSAETGNGSESAIGSTSEALIGSITVTVDTPPSVEFAAYFPISTTQVLVVGGFNSLGNGTTEIGIFDKSAATYTKVKDSANTSNDLLLPSNHGEQEIVKVDTDTYLIAGGRTNHGAAAVADSYILKLNVGGTLTHGTLTTGGNMVTAVVIGDKNFSNCDALSKAIVLGGITNRGMDSSTDVTTVAATDTIQFASYTAGSPPSVTWATVKNASDTSKPVRLDTARGYAPALPVSLNKFVVGGGTLNGTLALTSAETLTVNSSCQATNAVNAGSVMNPDYTATVSNSLPTPVARAAWEAQQTTFTPSGGSSTVFDFIVAGGNNNSTTSGAVYDLATVPLAYDANSDTWASLLTDGTHNCTITGRTYPRLVDDTSKLRLVTGIKPHTSGSKEPMYDTSAVNMITLISTSGVCSIQQKSGPADDTFANGDTRVGAVSGFWHSQASANPFIGPGANHINTATPTELNTYFGL